MIIGRNNTVEVYARGIPPYMFWTYKFKSAIISFRAIEVDKPRIRSILDEVLSWI